VRDWYHAHAMPDRYDPLAMRLPLSVTGNVQSRNDWKVI
jgi:hypothetical protein